MKYYDLSKNNKTKLLNLGLYNPRNQREFPSYLKYFDIFSKI